MSLLTDLENRLIRGARKERFAYLKSISPRRLIILLMAAFCLFAAIGFQSSMIGNRASYLSDGWLWALFSGLTAVGYLLVASRRPILIPLMMVAQFIVNFALIRFLKVFHNSAPESSFHAVVNVNAFLALILTTCAYTLFFVFINIEGRFAFRAQTELALAHGIQQTLAPLVHSTQAGCEIYGITAPSEKVGGDLVDAVALADGRVVAYIADVAGHGLQAGILMGMVKTAVRTCLLDTTSLPVLFSRLNRVLPAVKEAHMYATAAALLIGRSQDGACHIQYALAGHPPVLHLSATGQCKQWLADEQLPLGLFSFAEYRSQNTTAEPGDLLIITTDGILEVCNKQNAEFGLSGIESVAAVHCTEPLAELAAQILQGARSWGKQEDDQTLLLIRVM